MTTHTPLPVGKKRTILDIKVRDLFLVSILITLGIANILQGINAQFAYLDEICTVLLMLWAMGMIATGRAIPRQSASLKTIVVGLLALIGIGILGNLISQVQGERVAIALDIATVLKFFVALGASILIAQGSFATRELSQGFARLSMILITICMLVNSVLDIGMTHEIRFGFRAFTFLFPHPTMFAAFLVGLLALLFYDASRNWPFILLGSILLFSTMRAKAWGIALIIFLILLLFRRKRRIPISLIVLSVGGGLVVAYEQLQTYFFNPLTARSSLLRFSFDVASEYFPIGSGFATYASNASGAYYSDLYYRLGIENIFGLQADDYRYLVDSFWPIIIGQFGWLGLAVFLAVLAALVIQIARVKTFSLHGYWAAMIVMMYLAIASTSESAFFAPYAPFLALVIAIVAVPGRGAELDANTRSQVNRPSSRMMKP